MNTILGRKYRAANEFKERLLQSSVGHRIARIILFGSVLTGDAGEESDIDLLEEVKMPKQKEKMIPVTIYLTPEQIREAYRQWAERAEEEDWINDPAILEMLAKREKKVIREIKEGKFVTLEEFQNKLSK